MSDHKHSRDPLRNHGYSNTCSCGAFYDEGEWHEPRKGREEHEVSDYMMAPPGDVCLGWPDVVDEECEGEEG